jgi:hypothetical protein
MKRVIAFVIGVFCIGITFNAKAQDTKEQSKTKSALCTAQSETFKTVFDEVYTIQAKVDVNEVYKDAIAQKTAECLAADLSLWGKSVIADAQNGKFKKYRLSFEKPTDNKFRVPGKAKRAYKRAFKKAKKDFISTRKSKTLNEIMDDKYLAKYLAKVNKAFIRQKDKCLKKITK